MSWRVANTCAERKFGSAARKQIIMFLADKASDDGSGIWCSKGTIQRHTELGASTVKQTIRDFLKEGILVETGARTCKNGFTVVYRIDLANVEDLEPTIEPAIETGSKVDSVQPDYGTGATMPPVPGPQWSPNHLTTTPKPPTRKRKACEGERFLKAYPKDRIRGKAECFSQIEEALDEGFKEEDLLQAIHAYATETAGFTRSKVCFSDNWFRSGRWRSYAEDLQAKHQLEEIKETEMLQRLARWVKDRHDLCKHITAKQVEALLAAELVRDSELKAAGIDQ